MKKFTNSFKDGKELRLTTTISKEDVRNAEQVLIDNGIEPDEASTVLQAIGYVLLDVELFEKENDEHSTF